MRAVIVTGVSRGLGAALARALVERGAMVVGVGRSSAPGLIDDRYRFVACDFSDVAGIDAAVEPAFAALAAGKPREVCLVNNAATTEPMGIAAMHDSASVARAIAVNLAAPAALCGLFLRAFADRAIGRRIVNVSSGAARSAIAGVGLYCEAKAGLEMLTRVIAAEVRDARFAAVSLRPGVIDTDMQTAMRMRSEDEVPAFAMFRGFHADRRLVAPDVAAAKIADAIVLARALANGATYAWPDLAKPLADGG
ncbi:MAG: SDR family NAD(P)-dependent oxidoreductase [Betaproteobacteria bacterium]